MPPAGNPHQLVFDTEVSLGIVNLLFQLLKC
jgi:hypothetical protein